MPLRNTKENVATEGRLGRFPQPDKEVSLSSSTKSQVIQPQAQMGFIFFFLKKKKGKISLHPDPNMMPV